MATTNNEIFKQGSSSAKNHHPRPADEVEVIPISPISNKHRNAHLATSQTSYITSPVMTSLSSIAQQRRHRSPTFCLQNQSLKSMLRYPLRKNLLNEMADSFENAQRNSKFTMRHCYHNCSTMVEAGWLGTALVRVLRNAPALHDRRSSAVFEILPSLYDGDVQLLAYADSTSCAWSGCAVSSCLRSCEQYYVRKRTKKTVLRF